MCKLPMKERKKESQKQWARDWVSRFCIQREPVNHQEIKVMKLLQKFEDNINEQKF